MPHGNNTTARVLSIESSTPAWNAATRRLWLRTVGLVLAAAIVLSPAIAAVALLVSRFGFGATSAFDYMSPVMWLLGIAMNLLIWLWATRQALIRNYPEGRFELVPHQAAGPAQANTSNA